MPLCGCSLQSSQQYSSLSSRSHCTHQRLIPVQATEYYLLSIGLRTQWELSCVSLGSNLSVTLTIPIHLDVIFPDGIKILNDSWISIRLRILKPNWVSCHSTIAQFFFPISVYICAVLKDIPLQTNVMQYFTSLCI